MATVTDADGQAVSRETQVAALVATGMPAEFAHFVVALEQGDVTGDVIELDDEGEEPDGN
jgi:hypothetical protein